MFKIKSFILGFFAVTLLLKTGLMIYSIEDISYVRTEELTKSEKPYQKKAIENTNRLTLPHQQVLNLEPDILWNISVATDCEETWGLAIDDLNSDGEVEVIFGATHGWPHPAAYGVVHALNGSTSFDSWAPFKPGFIPITAPALGDIDNDTKVEMIFGCENGYVIAIEDDGKSTKWDYPMGKPCDTQPTLGDVDNDSKLEVIIGSSGGFIAALEAEDGNEKWKIDTKDQVTTSAALGDINNDQKVEVVVGSWNGYVYALNSTDGTQLWNYSAGLINRVMTPVLADLNNDQQLEVVFGDYSGNVTALTASNGSYLWHYPTGIRIVVSPSLGDIDNDKKIDIVIGNEERVYALDGNGSKIWTTNKLYPSSSASLGDIDNDNRLEVIFGGSSSVLEEPDTVFALNGEDGSQLWSLPYNNVYDPPALYDIDNDPGLEIIFTTYDSECSVVALQPQNSGIRHYWANGGSTSYTFTQNLRDIDPDMDFISTYSENIVGTNSSNPDSDNDGMLDGWEVSYSPHLDPWNNDIFADPDSDKLNNSQEYQLNTDPTNEDTDDDGMPDGWEVQHGLSPRYAASPTDDTDEDNLVDILEYPNTDPTNPDTDGDGLSDGEEVNIHNTNPTSIDSDTDGMNDSWEVMYYPTLDPNDNDNSADPDKDGLSNWREFQSQTNPADPDSDHDGLTDYFEVEDHPELNPLDNDSDGDTMLDGWEFTYSSILNPDDASDGSLDPDDDNLSNQEEFYYFLQFDWELDPTDNDTDDDGLSDGSECKEHYTNPTSKDTDNDTLSDHDEIFEHGTNPLKNDSDDDGLLDAEEVGELFLDPNDPDLNGTTLFIVYRVVPSGFLLLLSGALIFRFIYFPRRQVIRNRLHQWWQSNIVKLYRREEEIMEYAEKAQKIVETLEGKKIED